MRIAGTGHRPDKLGGYSELVAKRLADLAIAALTRHAPSEVISGMALGWDTALAVAAIRLGIPLIAAIPFAGQESKWPPSSQERYREILGKAARVEVVCPGGYAASKMQVRNEWMVNEADLILALWDGSAGGTGNCVDYANRVGKKLTNLWASWVRHKGI